jgi:hypothetical protein
MHGMLLKMRIKETAIDNDKLRTMTQSERDSPGIHHPASIERAMPGQTILMSAYI